ncbi:MAG: hypothetical protein WC869_01370 [Phycisphaerae bacterium]|jgi:hypothetical protein
MQIEFSMFWHEGSVSLHSRDPNFKTGTDVLTYSNSVIPVIPEKGSAIELTDFEYAYVGAIGKKTLVIDHGIVTLKVSVVECRRRKAKPCTSD